MTLKELYIFILKLLYILTLTFSQMSEGVNFFKEIFAKPFKKGVHFGVACPNK